MTISSGRSETGPSEEERARALEERLRLALEIARAGVWEWNVATDLVTGNEYLARLFGLSVEEVLAGRVPAPEFFRLIHPEDWPGVDQRLREIFATGGEYEIDYRIVLAGRPARWLSSRGRVELGSFRQVKRLTGLVFDITERKRAELSARFLLELDTVLSPLAHADEIEQAAMDRLGAYLNVQNCYFAQIVGTRAAVLREFRRGEESIVGDYELAEFFLPETREQFSQGVATVIEDVKTDARTASAADRYAAIGVRAFITTPVKYHDRWVGALNCTSREPRAWRSDELLLMQDLAARVWPLIEQARATQALREADRRKDEFLAMLAHELRNPLAPIRNAVQVLKMIGREDGHRKWAREIIERQTQHLTRLVDDLLDVSRITRGKVTLRREPLDLATVIHRSIEASRPLIDARHHRLTVDLPPEPVHLDGDLTRLVQVIGNLLNNAAKFTAEGGEIHIEAAQEGEMAVIRVRDNGMGLPADLLPHVFDLFTQADRSLDRSQGGLGIGLTLVRQLVEMHGGRVEAKSEGPGRGSELIVRLPAVCAGSG